MAKYLNLNNRMHNLIYNLKKSQMQLIKWLKIYMKMYKIYKKRESEQNLKQWKEQWIKFMEANNNHLF